MPIFICKNCGKLTESETGDEIVCASCGAPLDTATQASKEEVLQARRPSAKRPTPIRLPSTQPPSGQVRPAPKKPAAPAPKKPAAPAPKKPAAPAPKKPAAPAPRQQTRPVQLRPVDLPGVEAEKPSIVPSESSSGSPAEEAYVEPQASADTGMEGMEVYVNKDLVACPQCGYGCDPNWGKCPICEAPIAGSEELKKVTEMEFTTTDESSFTKGLIPCPKCQYYCDPSWGKCPICNSELKQLPASEKAESEKEEPEKSEPEPEEPEPE